MAHVTVHQLETRCQPRKCFMNVREEYLFLSVEGTTLDKPTFLVFGNGKKCAQGYWKVIQFENIEMAREWLEDANDEYDQIKELKFGELW